jgi:hypothetical protein
VFAPEGALRLDAHGPLGLEVWHSLVLEDEDARVVLGGIAAWTFRDAEEERGERDGGSFEDGGLACAVRAQEEGEGEVKREVERLEAAEVFEAQAL